MSTNNSPERELGRTMRFWLARACKDLRTQADVNAAGIADAANVSATTVWRVENSTNWPAELEAILAAYAERLGLPDNRSMWDEALTLWYAHGAPTVLTARDGAAPPKPSQQIAAEIEATVNRRAQKRAGRERAEKSTSTRKRRAAR